MRDDAYLGESTLRKDTDNELASLFHQDTVANVPSFQHRLENARMDDGACKNAKAR
jgi:hypothetical protein